MTCPAPPWSASRRTMQDVVPGKIILCDDPSQAAQGDAVICVTQSKDEFLKEAWLSPDTIVFPMGSYQECEDAGAAPRGQDRGGPRGADHAPGAPCPSW